MTDSIEDMEKIDRIGRHVRDSEKAAKKEFEHKESNLLVDACRKLAPLYDHTASDITKLWNECNQQEEDSSEAFQAEMRLRGMGHIAVFVHPNEGAPGRPRRDSLFNLVTDTKNTLAWKQFIEKLKENNGLAILVFKPKSKNKAWIMTNRETADNPKAFNARIVVPIKGAADVIVMPLEKYLEENL